MAALVTATTASSQAEGLETWTVSIYEQQSYAGKGEWVGDPKAPWLTSEKEPSPPPDEIMLPDADWTWVSNWKYEVKVDLGLTDRRGWEYA